jgi:hypothetical protein
LHSITASIQISGIGGMNVSETRTVLGDRNFTDQQIAELYWESKLGD